jgi:hypothetical protein
MTALTPPMLKYWMAEIGQVILPSHSPKENIFLVYDNSFYTFVVLLAARIVFAFFLFLPNLYNYEKQVI